MIKAELGQGQELGSQPTWVAGPQRLEPSPTASQGVREQRARSQSQDQE